MNNLLISFSGGRTSALMTKLILSLPTYQDFNIVTVFANTGKEKEETLLFVEKCNKEFNLNLFWLEAKVNPIKGKGTSYIITDFEKASRKGEPFEAVIKKYGLPSKLVRHCTRELKQTTINKFAKDYFKGEPYKTAIGIRADESHRIKQDSNFIYPLFDFGITEKQVRQFWELQSFDLELKDYEGNCDLCFLKSKRKRMTILKENPLLSEWWYKMENKYQNGYQTKFDALNDLSILELKELSKTKFRKVLDKHDSANPQLFELDFDIEFDCFCKNT
ncbi:phosphoadenosine phosphosulfate reductase family protein [Bernardetia sp. Wsw4-3y2]|uniref:phosphoadenosine phosphosulfate reductase domain-containing protein n=1 Tax=Bernardetia sp. Wsw4-3y2 TaxID=3127471 RepID=UPI0030CD044A